MFIVHSVFERCHTSIFIRSEGRAHSTADEDEHPNEADDPNDEGDVEVIGHGPQQWLGCRLERTGANGIGLCKQHGTCGNKNAELEEASEECAVDRANSESPPPSANEHKECVKADDSVTNTHESSDQGELRASFLAIYITVIHIVN